MKDNIKGRMNQVNENEPTQNKNKQPGLNNLCWAQGKKKQTGVTYKPIKQESVPYHKECSIKSKNDMQDDFFGNRSLQTNHTKSCGSPCET